MIPYCTAPCRAVHFLISFSYFHELFFLFIYRPGVSSIPEVFQYDLTALYAETCTTGGACPSSIPLGTIPQTSDTENKSETEIVSTKSLVNAVGEVAVRCVILIATDGLYDMMTNEKAVDIAFNHWSDPAAAAEEMLTQTGNTRKAETMR